MRMREESCLGVISCQLTFMPFEQLKMKLEKKQEEEDGGGGGAEKTAAKQRPRKKIFENIKFEEGVRALREEKEKFMLGEKENSSPNVVKDEARAISNPLP